MGDEKTTTNKKKTTEEKKIELPKDFCLLTLGNARDPDVKALWRYVYDRGLDEKDAWYFKSNQISP